MNKLTLLMCSAACTAIAFSQANPSPGNFMERRGVSVPQVPHTAPPRINPSTFISAPLSSAPSIPRTSAVTSTQVREYEYQNVAEKMLGALSLIPISESSSDFGTLLRSAHQKLNASQLNDFYTAVDAITEAYGYKYEALSFTEQMVFCLVRGIETFFKGDLINASAFLLEARQLNLTQSIGLKLETLAGELYAIRFSIDTRTAHVNALTQEQKTERLFFKLHLSKLLDSQHASKKKDRTDVFMVLTNLNKESLSDVKERNSTMYAHSVYLMAQHVALQIDNKKPVQNLNRAIDLIQGNLGYFNGMNSYREAGQRIYLSRIELDSPNWATQIIENITAFPDDFQILPPSIPGYLETIMTKFHQEKPDMLDEFCKQFNALLNSEKHKEHIEKFIRETRQKLDDKKNGTTDFLDTMNIGKESLTTIEKEQERRSKNIQTRADILSLLGVSESLLTTIEKEKEHHSGRSKPK